MSDTAILQAEQDELVRIFSNLPQDLRDKLLDAARMSEIFADLQKSDAA